MTIDVRHIKDEAVRRAVYEVATSGTATVVATGTTTARSLADRFADAIRVEDFGAVGDGSTDDTIAIQAALNATTVGSCVLLAPGKTYRVTNLTFPTTAPATFMRKGFICLGGNAIIKAISGGNTSYMAASARWVSGSAFADQPWEFANIIFDANNIANIAFVWKGYSLQLHSCQFKGGLTDSFLFTRRNPDGTDGTSGSYLAAFAANDCDFQSSGTYCFRTEAPDSDTTQGPTDGSLLNCTMRDANVYLANTAGWLVKGCRTWGQNEVKFDNLSRGFVCEGNNFDANDTTGFIILGNIVASYTLAQLGPGNVFYKPLAIQFSDNASTQEIIVHNSTFWTNGTATTDAYIEHRNNRTVKTITSRDNNFRTTNPHRLGTGVTLGTYRVEGGRGGAGPLAHDGLILPDYTTLNVPITPASGIRLFSAQKGTARRPAGVTSAGIHFELERRLATNTYGAVVPVLSVATPTTYGVANTVTGTAQARTWASTNIYTQASRVGVLSAAATDSSASFRVSNPPWWRGNTAGLGGFDIIIRGAINLYQVGMRAFIGVTNNFSLQTAVDPDDATNTDIIGIAKRAADTTWHLITNDNAGVATMTDLGVNFPADTSATDIYEVRLFCKANDSVVYYSVHRINTGNLSEGSVSSNLPRSQVLAGPQIWGNTGAGSVAIQMDMFGMSGYATAAF